MGPSIRSLKTHRLSGVVVASLLLTARSVAHAQLVDIGWDASGGFERAFDVAPGKFAELCGKLSKGQAVAWSFQSPEPLDFNIHYHAGKKVVFPARHGNTAALEGELKVPVDHDYCWMWENKAAAATTVTVKLRRR